MKTSQLGVFGSLWCLASHAPIIGQLHLNYVCLCLRSLYNVRFPQTFLKGVRYCQLSTPSSTLTSLHPLAPLPLLIYTTCILATLPHNPPCTALYQFPESLWMHIYHIYTNTIFIYLYIYKYVFICVYIQIYVLYMEKRQCIYLWARVKSHRLFPVLFIYLPGKFIIFNFS